MISLRYSEIPTFLRLGSFYDSLEEDLVTSQQDFAKMMKVIAFWGLYRIPLTVIQFCKDNEDTCWSELIREECTDLCFAQDLLTVFNRSSQNDPRNPPLVRAIKVGRTEIVEFLAVPCSSSTLACEIAATMGRLDYLQLLHLHGHPWNAAVCEAAAEKGHLDCLQYLHEQGCPWTETAHTKAAVNGHIKCIKYMQSQGLAWPEDMACYMAASGNMELLRYGISEGCKVDEYTLERAVMGGHTECLRYLLSLGRPVNARMVTLACQFGHVGCLELLHQHGAILTAQAMHNAVVCEQVASVQYLHKYGCTWNVTVTQVAANRGNIELLRYAMEHGCPYDSGIVANATLVVTEGSMQCLQYLVFDRKIPKKTDGSEFISAFTHGNYKAVQFLTEKGFPYLECSNALCKEWFSMLSDHYDSPRTDEDANIAKCMEYAVEHSWDICKYGFGLISFVRFSGSRFALCRKYLQDNGYC